MRDARPPYTNFNPLFMISMSPRGGLTGFILCDIFGKNREAIHRRIGADLKEEAFTFRCVLVHKALGLLCL